MIGYHLITYFPGKPLSGYDTRDVRKKLVNGSFGSSPQPDPLPTENRNIW